MTLLGKNANPSGLTEKVSPDPADTVEIQDSAASGADKAKKAQLGNLPGGGGASLVTDSAAGTVNAFPVAGAADNLLYSIKGATVAGGQWFTGSTNVVMGWNTSGNLVLLGGTAAQFLGKSDDNNTLAFRDLPQVSGTLAGVVPVFSAGSGPGVPTVSSTNTPGWAQVSGGNAVLTAPASGAPSWAQSTTDREFLGIEGGVLGFYAPPLAAGTGDRGTIPGFSAGSGPGVPVVGSTNSLGWAQVAGGNAVLIAPASGSPSWAQSTTEGEFLGIEDGVLGFYAPFKDVGVLSTTGPDSLTPVQVYDFTKYDTTLAPNASGQYTQWAQLSDTSWDPASAGTLEWGRDTPFLRSGKAIHSGGAASTIGGSLPTGMPTGGDFTIEVIGIFAQANGSGIFQCLDNVALGYSLETALNTNYYFQVRWYDGSGTSTLAASPSPELDAESYHYVALVHDDTANTMKLYVDGKLVATASSADLDATDVDKLNIGSADHAIQGVRIFDEALTDAQILESYTSTFFESVAGGGGSGGGGGFTDEAVSTTPVTITAPADGVSHLVEVDTSTSAITVNLPATPNASSEVIVKDATGDAATNNITVQGNGKLIDGQSSVVINVNDDFVRMRYTSSGEWRMV